MANPPIVIGSFDNVPAPGSPIKSDWPQEISTYVQALPRGLIGYNPPAGDQTISATSPVDIAGLSVTFTAVAGRRYKTSLNVIVSNGVATASTLYAQITDGAGGVINSAGVHLLASGGPGKLAVVHIVTVESALSGTVTRKARANVQSTALIVNGAGGYVSTITVEDLGTTLPT